MDRVKKMVLIEPNMLNSLRQPPVTLNKTVNVLNTLDEEMASVMKKSELTDRDKVRIYNDILQKYLSFKDKYNDQVNPLPVKVIRNEVQDVSKPIQEDVIEREIIDSVPKTMIKKAQLILNRIKNNSVIKWNEKGELIYKDTLIQGSNISDLINDTLRHRREFTPNGWQVFSKGLKEINIPLELVGNKERWDFINNPVPTKLPVSTSKKSKPLKRIDQAIKWTTM